MNSDLAICSSNTLNPSYDSTEANGEPLCCLSIGSSLSWERPTSFRGFRRMSKFTNAGEFGSRRSERNVTIILARAKSSNITLKS